MKIYNINLNNNSLKIYNNINNYFNYFGKKYGWIFINNNYKILKIINNKIFIIEYNIFEINYKIIINKKDLNKLINKSSIFNI